jgi:hypothetical protein
MSFVRGGYFWVRFSHRCKDRSEFARVAIESSNGQVNPGRRSECKHKLSPFQYFDGPTQCHRVKIPAQFDSL